MMIGARQTLGQIFEQKPPLAFDVRIFASRNDRVLVSELGNAHILTLPAQQCLDKPFHVHLGVLNTLSGASDEFGSDPTSENKQGED